MAITPAVRAKALYGAGVLACSQNDAAVVEACCGESLTIFRELGDTQGVANSLYKLGQAAWLRNNLHLARTLIEEACTLFRQGSNRQGLADALIILGLLCLDEGEYAQTYAAIEESLALFQATDNMGGLIFSLVTLASLNFLQNELVVAHTQAQQCLALSRKVGDRWNIGRCLIVLALVAFAQGESALAHTHAEEALHLFKAMDSQDSIALSLFSMGLAVFGQGEYSEARRLCEESLAIAIALSHKEFLSIFPVGLAAVAAALGATKASLVEIRWAAQILGAAERYRETSGIPLPCIVSAMQDSVVLMICAQLGQELFATLWSEGRTLTVEQAVAAQGRSMPAKQLFLTLAELPLLPIMNYPAGLTAREVEVLRWVAMGLTNIQIGKKMVISPRTVGTHLSSIYNKLGITTRSAAARFAAEHHLHVASSSAS
jgi:DNA-binding CsgD family transcriptional regulator